MRYCMNCGRDLGGNAFCMGCGTRAPDAPPAGPPAAAPQPAEVLTSAGPPPWSPTPAGAAASPAGARGKGRLALVMTLVVALVVASAGGVVAYRWWKGSSPDLASRLPATVAMYGGVNLDPSGSQKADALRLARALPSELLQGGSDIVDGGRRSVVSAISSLVGVDSQVVDRAFSSWFGGQAGFAETGAPYAESGQGPARQLVVASVTDEAKFRAAWDEWMTAGPRSGISYQIKDGIVVIGDGDLKALPQNASDSLAQTPGYSAVRTVLDDTVAWVWVSNINGGPDPTPFPAPGGKQGYAAGVRITSSGVEVSGVVLGMTPQLSTPAAPTATGSDVAASMSVTSTGGLFDSVKRAYRLQSDGVADSTATAAQELLARQLTLAVRVANDGTMGLVGSAKGGAQGARTLIDAWRQDLPYANGDQPSGVESNLWDQINPSALLDAIDTSGTDATIAYRVPDGGGTGGGDTRDAVPNPSAPFQMYVSMPRVLMIAGLRDSLRASGDDSTLRTLDAIDTVGLSVSGPADGRAEFQLRIRLKVG